eukprot:NODE_765_length_1194_cov_91.394760_g617_i0.p1 GENE.NODE_765_length_1194_cov_91.394760_g617_i0~~NODE_765_length_1194_cov_91.394760_g617_i0.p1  ORF type:complete len:329 (-),score=67.11 NODE_765_length_1194_cov_91.394760_g617_i0:117-1103(-)
MQTTQARTQPGEGSFTYTQQPASVPGKRSKYRDPYSSSPIQTNIMYDKRVVRGNTYSAQVLPLSAQAEIAMAQKEAERQRKRISTERRKQRTMDQEHPITPPPVQGRKHVELQTESYLEELTDKVEEVTVDTQTDPMMNRPMSPMFVPAKSGRDAETQIADGDLFDFDLEVEPILEVMVGKTLEQAMLEVMQEEELENMRQQQQQFEQRRREELIETQRLEAAERRKFEEKEARKKQEHERLQRERVTREKLAARMFAKQFLGNLELRVFARLEDEGWFHDAVEREVETSFMPWLADTVSHTLDERRKARKLVDDLVRHALSKSAVAA